MNDCCCWLVAPQQYTSWAFHGTEASQTLPRENNVTNKNHLTSVSPQG